LKKFFPTSHGSKESNTPTRTAPSQLLCHLHSYSFNSPHLQALHFCTLSELSLTDQTDLSTGKTVEELKLIMYLITKSCELYKHYYSI